MRAAGIQGPYYTATIPPTGIPQRYYARPIAPLSAAGEQLTALIYSMCHSHYAQRTYQQHMGGKL
jgi:hypothetical protein